MDASIPIGSEVRPGQRRLRAARRAVLVAALLVGPSIASGQLVGGSYRLLGQSTGGGGRSEAGTWSIVGSVAVPVCAVSLGGAYTLNGGLVGAWALPVEPLFVQIERADATTRLTFTGTLQSATSIDGPWADVEGAVSPHEVTPSLAARFFRARQ